MGFILPFGNLQIDMTGQGGKRRMLGIFLRGVRHAVLIAQQPGSGDLRLGLHIIMQHAFSMLKRRGQCGNRHRALMAGKGQLGIE